MVRLDGYSYGKSMINGRFHGEVIYKLMLMVI